MEIELALMSREIQYPEVYELGIKIHFLIRGSRKDPQVLYRLFKLCNSIKPDIIHTWDSMTSMYAVPITKLLGISLVNGMITDSSYRNNVLKRGWIRPKITFPLSDVIVGNSHAGLRAYKAPKSKSVCIYNGFNRNRLEKLIDCKIIKDKFNIRTSKVVGMVAGFTDRKDYESFIESAHNILQQRNDVTFVAVGDGENLEKCKSMVTLDNQEKIKFIGLQNDIESIINIFNVGVLTTNVDIHNEGISNSILEYMALGKPVIATDSGGSREIIVEGLTGFLVPPKDSNQLTNRIIELLDNPIQATEMGSRGKQRVFEVFSIETMVGQYVDLYNDLFTRRARK